MNGESSGILRGVAANPEPLVTGIGIASSVGPEAILIMVMVVFFGWLARMITKEPPQPIDDFDPVWLEAWKEDNPDD